MIKYYSPQVVLRLVKEPLNSLDVGDIELRIFLKIRLPFCLQAEISGVEVSPPVVVVKIQ